MPLRPYQETDVQRIREAVMRSRAVCYTCATGSGKTVTATAIAEGATSKGNSVLFLCHRRELIKQSVDTIYEAMPSVQLGVVASGWPELPWAGLQIGMVQTIARRKNWRFNPKIIIIDEAHHARAKTWEVVLQRWPNAKLIGLTATPQRLDNKGLGQHFAELILGPTIPELVQDGYLAPSRTLRIPSSLVLEGVRKDRHGEYREDDVAARVTDAVIADAVGAYQRYAFGKRAIFFGIHRSHSKLVCEGLRAIGVRAEHVDGTDSMQRRDRVMNLFKTGGLDVLCNVQLIDEGFDAPACEVVMLGAPTTSVTRYLQQAGRAMRPGPNKTALILDLAGISHDLGLPDDIREWSLSDGEIREGAKAHKTPNDCPRCQTVFWGRICPACNHSEPLAEVQTVDTELEEATGATAKPVKGGRRKELNRELAVAHRAPDKERALLEIAERRGYKRGWAAAILRVWATA